MEYFVADTTVYLFKLDQNSFKVQKIHFPDLAGQLKKFRAVLAEPSVLSKDFEQVHQQFVEHSRLFYQKLIAPAELDEQIKQLIIVPDGLLNHIPFEILVKNTPSAEKASYKELPYLLKDYAISYSFSIALLLEAQLHPIKAPNHKILAYAPTYDAIEDLKKASMRSADLQRIRSILEDLPGARQEVLGLEQEFKGHFNYDYMAGEADFRANVSDYGIIHLAMHGKLNEKEPLSSGLIFSETGDSTADNVLYAYEINDLSLNAELIVLSACETGYGKFQHGEGVMSIARSFMYAGTHSLLMTLWTVSDISTQQLMNNFYQNLAKGMRKDVALQQAKLQYLNSSSEIGAHPFLWAGFVALGDPAATRIQEKGGAGLGWILGAIGLLVLGLGLWWARRMSAKNLS